MAGKEWRREEGRKQIQESNINYNHIHTPKKKKSNQSCPVEMLIVLHRLLKQVLDGCRNYGNKNAGQKQKHENV